MSFASKQLGETPDVTAPDGSAVRILCVLERGSMAHFELAPGQTSRAVCHRTVDEIWLFLAGQGEMWRKLGDQEEILPVGPMLCVTIPVGTHFQFRAAASGPLSAVGVTMPKWPGEEEAPEVDGIWESG